MNSIILISYENLQQTLGRRTPPSRLKENLNLYRYLMHGKDIKESRALPYIIYPEVYIILVIVAIVILIKIQLFMVYCYSLYFNENIKLIIQPLCERHRQYMFESIFYLLSKKPRYAIALHNRYIQNHMVVCHYACADFYALHEYHNI